MSNANAIRSLLPGRSIVLSSSNGIAVKAERSGNGKTLRIVREHRDGFEVIQTTTFAGVSRPSPAARHSVLREVTICVPPRPQDEGTVYGEALFFRVERDGRAIVPRATRAGPRPASDRRRQEPRLP